jgi:3-deoxy-D-manno-octulosonic-acid transferase
MKPIWRFLYNIIVVPGFWLTLHIVAPFHEKVRRGISGRRNLFGDLSEKVKRLPASRRIWFHSSSMGEFEQAKPIIAALRKRHKNLGIIATFFSPSGYEHSRTYRLADVIAYLPFDTTGNAKKFLDLVAPSAAVMVRYDVWPNFIAELHRRQIPTVIANATLRANSSRFSWPLRQFHAGLYDQLTSILTVSESDARQFGRFGLKSPGISVIGDTRYDQVFQRSEDARTKHLLPPAIVKGRRIVVVGSSWPEDVQVVLPAFQKVVHLDPRSLLILVPHEPTIEAIEELESFASVLRLRSIRFSDLNDYTDENVILVDSIGILMILYQYADVAYVGGSFKQGVHNVLEPAVYSIPILYGPKHENSQEALELVRRGGGFVVRTKNECFRTLRSLLQDRRSARQAGSIAGCLVKENVGATEKILAVLEQHLRPRKVTP